MHILLFLGFRPSGPFKGMSSDQKACLYQGKGRESLPRSLSIFQGTVVSGLKSLLWMKGCFKQVGSV